MKTTTIDRKAKTGRPSRRPSAERLNEQYITWGWTAKKIAAFYGVSEATVRGWIRYYRNGGKYGKH